MSPFIRALVALTAVLVLGCTPATQGTRGMTDVDPQTFGTTPTGTAEFDAAAATLPRVAASASYRAFPSFSELVRASDLVVSAEVVSLVPGRRVADNTGTDVLPFTNVSVRVTEVAKGDTAIGTTLVVEQTGGIYRPTHAIADSRGEQATLPPDAPSGVQPLPPAVIPDRDVLYELKEDPLLRRGERVVLALRWRAQLGVYQLSSLQGRFNVTQSGTVQTLLRSDPVVGPLDGISVSELFSRVAQVR